MLIEMNHFDKSEIIKEKAKIEKKIKASRNIIP